MIQNVGEAAADDDDNLGGPAGPAPSAGPKELPWRGEIFDHRGKKMILKNDDDDDFQSLIMWIVKKRYDQAVY